ncbi:hypothetical protein F441_20442 [Phytophthora nicotianae CJ01A1]|uniref:Uncharacterized protein n=1 Tax=Phytophthora nicotianae CJ01A1 TaxID=1317063 RepID=W2VYQ7_PHYNI|nr:hypothetical protein F441_20442 [Phytophthora nicotianae CJ01A1]
MGNAIVDIFDVGSFHVGLVRRDKCLAHYISRIRRIAYEKFILREEKVVFWKHYRWPFHEVEMAHPRDQTKFFCRERLDAAFTKLSALREAILTFHIASRLHQDEQRSAILG